MKSLFKVGAGVAIGAAAGFGIFVMTEQMSSADAQVKKAPAAKASSAKAESIGSIDGKSVPESTLTNAEKARLFEAKEKYYQALESVLYARVFNEMVKEYADKNKIKDLTKAEDDYLNSLRPFKGPSSEAEFKTFFERYKSHPQMASLPEDQKKERLQQAFERQGKQEAYRIAMTAARTKHKVEVGISKPVAPRFEIKPNGRFHYVAKEGHDPSKAKIVLHEATDYQCPACASTMPYIRDLVTKRYKDKVKWVFLDFPLKSIHPAAKGASVAGRCVGQQAGHKAYAIMHDKLFENYKVLNTDNYKKWAQESADAVKAKFDAKKFENCLADIKVQDAVEADLKYGESLGVNGTPTFFVNGIKTSANKVPQLIEDEIKRLNIK